MRILVSNDDGIFSPGLAALAQVAAKFGDVIVVAPDVEQSAMSHAITIQRPLQFRPAKVGTLEGFRVNGTPADCVAMGLYLCDKPDLVLSGINLGSNLGHDVWHSGTVAAAKQAAFLGIPGVAFSLCLNGDDPDWEATKPYVEQVLDHLLAQEKPILVNVNLPLHPTGDLCWTYQSVRAYNGQVVPGEDPQGRVHYWFSATPVSAPDKGSDRWAVEQGMISLTPITLDVTDRAWLKRLQPAG
jgi:5'-nucleotidase